jgi:hypothetical protein
VTVAEVIHAIAAAVALIIGYVFEMRRGSNTEARLLALESRPNNEARIAALESTFERFRRNL